MKFVTFGTSVIDKAIVASGKHQNELRITRVSPFVLWCNNQSQGDILDFDRIKEKSSLSIRHALLSFRRQFV